MLIWKTAKVNELGTKRLKYNKTCYGCLFLFNIRPENIHFRISPLSMLQLLMVFSFVYFDRYQVLMIMSKSQLLVLALDLLRYTNSFNYMLS